METSNGRSHGMGRLLSAVENSSGVPGFVIVEDDELATGFRRHRFDSVRLFRQRFELILLAENSTHSQGVIESRASFLKSGVVFEICLETSLRIDDFGDADLFAGGDGDPSGEIEGVDRFRRRIGLVSR